MKNNNLRLIAPNPPYKSVGLPIALEEDINYTLWSRHARELQGGEAVSLYVLSAIWIQMFGSLFANRSLFFKIQRRKAAGWRFIDVSHIPRFIVFEEEKRMQK